MKWDFGDGSDSVISQKSSVNHTYSNNGSYSITLTVTDEDGDITTRTLDMIVNNIAPVITEIIGDNEIDEGEEVSYNAKKNEKLCLKPLF